jgi:hypothetical protein
MPLRAAVSAWKSAISSLAGAGCRLFPGQFGLPSGTFYQFGMDKMCQTRQQSIQN